MILTDFGSFRSRFATLAVAPVIVTVDFVAPSLPTLGRITRSVDEWNVGANPFSPNLEVGMRLMIVGSASNDEAFTIDSFSGDFDLFVKESNIVTEGPVALTSIEGQFFDDTGFPTWPVQFMRVGDTAASFAAGFSTLNSSGDPLDNAPYDGDFIRFSPNTLLADSVLNVDEYDWYMSQRTDDPAKKYLTVAQRANSGGQSFSGTCVLTPTALAQAKFNFTPGIGPIDPSITRNLFRGTDLYVRRISDQAIQRLNLLPAYLGF